MFFEQSKPYAEGLCVDIGQTVYFFRGNFLYRNLQETKDVDTQRGCSARRVVGKIGKALWTLSEAVLAAISSMVEKSAL